MAGKKETFLLVSLNEDKAKELAQVVSNNTSRKILDHLSESEATESEIANSLKLPISTVHYNLQQLIKGGLVVAEEFHYSKKGREVNHYKLANKYIIIAPKSTHGIKEKLKKLLPAFGFLAVGAAVIQLISSLMRESATGLSRSVSAVESDVLLESKSFAVENVVANVSAVSEPALQSFHITSQTLWQYATFWFLIGGFVLLLFMLVVDIIRKK